jgi:type VI protein secretion system component VasK
MWILQFLPDSLILWATTLLLVLGAVLTIAGWFAHRLPVIYHYQLPFKIVGVVLLVLGVYLRGGYAVEHEWRQRVADLEAQLKVAKEQSAQVNTVIQDRVVTKTQVIREKADTLVQFVEREIFKDREIVKEVNNCPVPQEAIDVHNEAARMNKIIEEQRKGAK